MIKQIVACIDGSSHATNVCELAAWAHKQTAAPLQLLHVIPPRNPTSALGDLSGQLGMEARATLLEELTQLDEAHGKLEQRKGQLLLEKASARLKESGLPVANIWHRRGRLGDVLQELDVTDSLVVMGKRGEHAHAHNGHLGANLQRVIRAVQSPILLADGDFSGGQEVLFAYDGHMDENVFLHYVTSTSLLKFSNIHVLYVGESSPQMQAKLAHIQKHIAPLGGTVRSEIRSGKDVLTIIKNYIFECDISILVAGAYGHSKLHRLLLGSVTTALLEDIPVATLLCR